MVDAVMYSSKSGKHRTPPELYDAANARWGPFILDAAATVDDCMGNCVFLPDAFICDWYGRVWLNPPYGREIGKWIERAWTMVDYGLAERVVCLLPARTDTRWWQDFIVESYGLATVHYLPGRVHFLTESSEEQGPAPFPSAIVVFEKPFSYKRGK